MTIKLKIIDIVDLYNALSSLDSYPKSVKKATDETIVNIPYSFNGKFRWNLSKNLGILETHVKDYVKVRDALIKQYALAGESTIEAKTNPEGWKAFSIENDKLGEEEVELNNLLKLSVDELIKDENPVPASILNRLNVLLDAIKE